MVGKLAWLGLRERARNELGSRFDIRDFHETALLSGCMPLAVLDRVMQDYIRVRRGKPENAVRVRGMLTVVGRTRIKN
jgi:Bacterial protein of unknown function (DUF885)